jgi:hypothetical protein
VTRRPRRTTWIGLGILATAMAIALFVILPRLPNGFFGIHVQRMLVSRITVCDRNYHGGDLVRTRAEIDARGAPMVLVDPGPFGIFPSCPAPDAQGFRPCTREASDDPCATVVYVRVGDDSYAEYELVGGP